MINKYMKKIIYIFILLIQVLLIAAAFTLNSLTETKAGVMHHVYYKRYEYEQGIYSQNNLKVQAVLAIIFCIIFIALLAWEIKRKKSIFYNIQLILGSIEGLLVYFVINSTFFVDMLAYPYFIMAFEITLAIQIFIIIGTKILKKI
ncbi:hypothetical protein NRP93_002792 [Clostridium botulinum]|nr:hypothetical protein [Clostridium botulinum]